MNQRRRSLLQTELILELDNRPAKTITDLAERVNAMRPSVSRSLKILQEQKLLMKQNGKWQLTEEGMKEAVTSKKMLLDTTEKVRVFAQHTDNSLMKNVRKMLSMSEFQRSIINSPAMRLMNEIVQNQIADMKMYTIASDMGKAIGNFPISPDFLKLNSAITPLLNTQELNTQLMRDALSMKRFAGLEEIIKNSNVQLASAIANTLAIRQEEFLKKIKSSIDFDKLFAHLININEAHEKIFGQYVEQIKFSAIPPANFDIIANIALPTATVAFYNVSVRNLFDAETEKVVESSARNFHNNELGDETLDIHLAELNPDLVEIRKGSWLALASNRPDHLRQAATSQRELLRQVLELLVPNSLLSDKNKQGPQIKMRAKIVLELEDRDAEFIDVCAKAVLSYYDELNKYTHHNEKHEESLRAIFHTGEGLLRFLLTKKNFYRQ